MNPDASISWLRSTSPINETLTLDPQVSFFKSEFSRHAPFSWSDVQVHGDKKPDWGGNVRFELPKESGDLLGQMYLYLKVGRVKYGIVSDGQKLLALPSDSYPVNNIEGIDSTHDNFKQFWVESLGYAAVKTCRLKFGSYTSETLTGDFMHIWDSLTRNSERSYVKNLPMSHGGKANSGTRTDQHIYVPLQFYFNRDYANAIPIKACPYTQISVEVEFNKKPYAKSITEFVNPDYDAAVPADKSKTPNDMERALEDYYGRVGWKRNGGKKEYTITVEKGNDAGPDLAVSDGGTEIHRSQAISGTRSERSVLIAPMDSGCSITIGPDTVRHEKFKHMKLTPVVDGSVAKYFVDTSSDPASPDNEYSGTQTPVIFSVKNPENNDVIAVDDGADGNERDFVNSVASQKLNVDIRPKAFDELIGVRYDSTVHQKTENTIAKFDLGAGRMDAGIVMHDLPDGTNHSGYSALHYTDFDLEFSSDEASDGTVSFQFRVCHVPPQDFIFDYTNYNPARGFVIVGPNVSSQQFTRNANHTLTFTSSGVTVVNENTLPYDPENELSASKNSYLFPPLFASDAKPSVGSYPPAEETIPVSIYDVPQAARDELFAAVDPSDDLMDTYKKHLVTTGKTVSEIVGTDAFGGDIKECGLVSRYFNLSTAESSALLAAPRHQYLQTKTVFEQAPIAMNTKGKFRVDLKYRGAVREIIWFYRKKAHELDGDLNLSYWDFRGNRVSPYEGALHGSDTDDRGVQTTSLKTFDAIFEAERRNFSGSDFFSSANLLLNNAPLFQPARDPVFFSYFNAAHYHTKVPVDNDYQSFYCMSFGVDPEHRSPNGSLNTSNFSSVSLELDIPSELEEGTVYVMMRAHNVVEVTNGMIGVRHAD